MINLNFSQAINPELLDNELRAALPGVYVSLLGHPGEFWVVLSPTATEAQQAQVTALVAAHDPNALSDRQQAAAERDQHPFFTMTEDEIALWMAEQTELQRWRAIVKFITWARDRIR